MARNIEIKPNGRFAIALVSAMQDKGYSLNKMAEETESTYEHFRKLIKGLAYPSPRLLRDICKVLGLKQEQMEEFVNADKIKHKYGNSAARIFRRAPDMEEVDNGWAFLTDEQKATITGMVSMFTKQNRANKRGA
jgi:transcriptional regulator with XRE-family HTH domain